VASSGEASRDEHPKIGKALTVLNRDPSPEGKAEVDKVRAAEKMLELSAEAPRRPKGSGLPRFKASGLPLLERCASAEEVQRLNSCPSISIGGSFNNRFPSPPGLLAKSSWSGGSSGALALFCSSDASGSPVLASPCALSSAPHWLDGTELLREGGAVLRGAASAA